MSMSSSLSNVIPQTKLTQINRTNRLTQIRRPLLDIVAIGKIRSTMETESIGI